MKVFLTNKVVEGMVEVNDTRPFKGVEENVSYFLRVTTGKYTTKAFYTLYFLKRDVWVSTTNLEFFISRIQPLRGVSIVCEKGGDVEDGVGCKYERVVKMITSTTSNPPPTNPSTYFPNVFKAILSSLKKPSLYSSSYPPLEDILSLKHPTLLKNLLFTRVILRKGDGFILNPLLDASL